MLVFGNMSRRADLENKKANLKLLRPMPQARILEVGPGDENIAVQAGQILGAVQTTGLEYYGCAAAASKPGFQVLECDINEERWPFADGSFDVILGNQVIEHLPNTDHFMKEIARLLSDRGYAVISTPNLGSFVNIAMLLFTWQGNHNHVSDEFCGLGNPLSGMRWHARVRNPRQHMRLFTLRALCDLAKVHGLKTEQRHGGCYGIPYLGRIMTAIDPWHSLYANIRCSKTTSKA